MSVIAGVAMWLIGQHGARAEERRRRKLAYKRARAAHPAGRALQTRRAS